MTPSSLASTRGGTWLLLRHGTPEPRPGRYRGQTREPLAPRGEWEAQQVAKRLQGVGVKRIVSSDLPRAAQTAAIVGAALGVDVAFSPCLREISFGRFEEWSYDDVRRCFGPDLDFWWRDPVRRGPPGGESLLALTVRVGAWMEAMEEPNAGESVLVVGHDASLKALLWQALGLDTAAFWRVSLGHAALTGLERSGGSFRLLFLNEACHLAGYSRAPTADGRSQATDRGAQMAGHKGAKR